MILKIFLRAVLLIIAINIGLLLAATLLDILLAAFFVVEIAPVCFAVAGIFSGAFCYSAAIDKIPREKRKRALLLIMLLIVVFSILLFYPLAPLSGSEYNLAFKCFAGMQLLTAIWLWKIKFYKDEI